jgi:hypothetical protein
MRHPNPVDWLLYALVLIAVPVVLAALMVLIAG